MFLLCLALILPALCLGAASPTGATGQRCCQEAQVHTDEGCVPKETTGAFEPPVSSPQEVSWSLNNLTCPENYLPHHVDIRNGSLFIEDATVKLKWKDPISRRTTEFCVAVDAEGHYKAILCRPDVQKACRAKPCVQRCCAEGDILTGLECVRNESLPQTKAGEVRFVVSTPRCGPRHFLTFYDPSIDGENEFSVSKGGALTLQFGDWHELGSYCLAYGADGSVDRAIYCAQELSELVKWKNRLQNICLIVSCVFLILTILNLALNKKLRDVQGLCFLCHMMSLLVADAALVVSAWFTGQMSPTHCVINGFIVQYSFLATFAWITIMCFDIWRVVKATVSLVPLNDILASDDKKFKVYCAFAFGLPLAVVSATTALQLLPEDLLPAESFFRPKIGVTSCWFHGHSERLLYFYGPVGLFSVMSLAFLGHTIVMLLQTGSICRCCSKNTPITAFNRNHLQSFWQRFSLFCLSVLCWVTEFLSGMSLKQEVWVVTDIINSLQGFIVFFIFFTSKKKRRLVYQSWESTVSSVVSRATKTFSRSDSGNSS
ncbi:probable G-protein coupled receptor Mth-like 3 [Penaeus japonicus]|uniref:probable G-protein coupled receptor Mth-like 3 n=1 Tax=Penaeus japonicus TaxID=27405 RepID=UPI001C712FB8|nr:probable G-protein coupled receptor Mth-like 3 [Penaeus japonicus]